MSVKAITVEWKAYDLACTMDHIMEAAPNHKWVLTADRKTFLNLNHIVKFVDDDELGDR